MASRKLNPATILVLVLVLVLVLSNANVGTHRTQISFVPPCSPYPTCVSTLGSTTSGATTNGATTTITGSAYVSSGVLAETWQKWTIHYQDGSIKQYDGSVGLPVRFDLIQSSSAPAWIDVIVPVVLDIQLHYHADPWPVGTVWHEELRILPYASAIVDTLQVGQMLTLTPIVFTNDDPLGKEIDYTVRVIFSGNPGSATGPYAQTIDATGKLNGKSSANFDLYFHQVVSQWVSYTSAPVISGGWYHLSPCPDIYGYVPLPYSCQVGPSKAFDPPGTVSFQWTPGACVGGCTVTAQTIHYVTCPTDQGGTSAICVSQTSVNTMITTKGLTVTIIANQTVVSILPNNNLNNTSGVGPYGTSGACKIQSGLIFGSPSIALPDWMCESFLGISVWIWLIIAAALALLYLGTRSSGLSVNLFSQV